MDWYYLNYCCSYYSFDSSSCYIWILSEADKAALIRIGIPLLIFFILLVLLLVVVIVNQNLVVLKILEGMVKVLNKINHKATILDVSLLNFVSYICILLFLFFYAILSKTELFGKMIRIRL